MRNRVRNVIGPILLLGLASGCETAPPGAGFTNGAAPTSAEEKPALRTDMPAPTPAEKGEILGGIDDGATQAGSGSAARGGGTAGAPQPKAGESGAVRANPPRVESSAPGTAAGGTKPAGEIETGTPRGPQ